MTKVSRANRRTVRPAASPVEAARAFDPKALVASLPGRPGVYRMFDRAGQALYVGKARDLRRRLSSYFMASRRTRADLKTRALIDTIADFEIHLVRN